MTSNGVSDTVYLTRERLVELEHELRELKTNGRKTMAQKIADARSHGDLSENAEYDAAKEEQQHLELKISKLELTLSRAKIIEAKDLPNDKIYILSRVTVKDMKTGETFEYLLVSPEDPGALKIKALKNGQLTDVASIAPGAGRMPIGVSTAFPCPSMRSQIHFSTRLLSP